VRAPEADPFVIIEAPDIRIQNSVRRAAFERPQPD
jgi:hypothetical protein